MKTIEVDIAADHVSISDDAGEIVYWDEAEWIEDPSLTPAIANAIRIGFTEGAGALREMIRRGASR